MTRKLLPIEPTEEMIKAAEWCELPVALIENVYKDMVAAYGKKSKGAQRTFKQFVDDCAESGEPPISGYKPVMDYAESVGLPPAYLNLAWQRFKDEYADSRKLYTDWRKAFLNCVKGNWFRLWYISDDGKYVLTTVGKQAIMSLKVEV